MKLRAIMAGSGMLGVLAAAHPDPSHNIELITAQIEAGDHRPALYYSRGIEYRAMGSLSEAEKDLRQCAVVDHSFLPARKDLALVLLEQKRFDEAAAEARQAIDLSLEKSSAVRASCWMVLARIELARSQFASCLEATQQAMNLVPRGELDWYLVRAEALRGLNRAAAAIDDLRAGYETLKSSVLRTAWIDALIESSRGHEALPTIESEMAQCRYKATWLIRRARVRLATADPEGAHSDLRAALNELNLRIQPGEPDPMLLVERGVTFALLGEQARAAQELAEVCAITMEADLIAPLQKLVAAAQPEAAPE